MGAPFSLFRQTGILQSREEPLGEMDNLESVFAHVKKVPYSVNV